MQFHHPAKVASDQRAALNAFRQRARADDVERGRLGRRFKERADRMILLRRIGVGGIGGNGGAAARRVGQAHHAGHGPIAVRSITGLVEDLAKVVESHAPAIRARHATAEKPVEPQGAGTQAPDRRAVEPRDAPRRFDARHGVQSLREPQAAIRPVSNGVHELVRVADAEPAEDHAPHVSALVAIRVAQVHNLIEVADKHAAFALHHG